MNNIWVWIETNQIFDIVFLYTAAKNGSKKSKTDSKYFLNIYSYFQANPTVATKEERKDLVSNVDLHCRYIFHLLF